MVFEEMLTILLGTGAGVAVVLYTVKPRQIGASQSIASGVSSNETISFPAQSSAVSQSDAAPAPEVTVTSIQPVVEAPVEEVHANSSSSVPTTTAESAAAGLSDAIAPIDASAVSVPVASPVTVGPRASSGARSHRAPRKSAAASSRTHAKPRATDSAGRAIRKS